MSKLITRELPLIITLDGPAGVGKSTLAKNLARDLDLAYLDTGAMFRTIAYKALKDPKGKDILAKTPEGGEELLKLLGPLFFTLESKERKTTLSCNGKSMGQEIRTETVADAAAKTGQMPPIRAFLKTAQQKIGEVSSLVAEGRDMGTEVFPNARLKFFLDASPEVRAERRFKQLKEMGQSADLEEITKQIIHRDNLDRNRKIAPLKPADDAHTIDTSDINIDEVLEKMKAIIYA